MADVIPAQSKGPRFSESEIAALVAVAKEPDSVRSALEWVNLIADWGDDPRFATRKERISARLGDHLVLSLWTDPNVRKATDGTFFYASGNDKADRVANEVLNHPDIQAQMAGSRQKALGAAAFVGMLDRLKDVAVPPSGTSMSANLENTLRSTYRLSFGGPAKHDPEFERPADTVFESRLSSLALPSARALRAEQSAARGSLA